MKKLLPIALLLIAFSAKAQLPKACFTGDSVGSPPCTISFTDLSTGNPTSWFWDFTGGTPAVSTIQHPSSITWQNQGTFDVYLGVNNTLGADSKTIVGVVTFTANTCYFDTTIYPCNPTGLQNLNKEAEPMSIHPNPTSGKFTIANATAEIQIFDLFGRLVLQTNKAEIDMSSYPSGLYVWSVGTQRGKLILE